MVLVAQDAKSFDAPNPVFDLNSSFGNFSVALLLFRRQLTTLGSLLRSVDLRMLLIGISFITKDGLITQRLRQFLFESALFVELDVRLWSAMARIHVEALGGTLTKLTKDQAEYIGVDVEGPYKPDHYRY